MYVILQILVYFASVFINTVDELESLERDIEERQQDEGEQSVSEHQLNRMDHFISSSIRVTVISCFLSVSLLKGHTDCKAKK